MVRLNVVRSCYQKTSAAVLSFIVSPAVTDQTADEYNKKRRRQLYFRDAHEQARLLGGARGYNEDRDNNDGVSPAVSCLINRILYAIFFCFGVLLAGFIMLMFDRVKPCGESLGETLLTYVANVTNTRWNISATKYAVECPRYPPTLVGQLSYPPSQTPTYKELADLYASSFIQDPSIGGHFKPNWCQAVGRVAIIVPYRDRDENLRVFLYYMHKIMQHQLLDYAIFVVEQAGPASIRFNRGVLLNVGFTEAMKAYNFDCALFYDVDKIPVDDRCSHVCPKPGHVRHMAAYQDRFQQMAFRDEYFGGVLAINSEDVLSLNGFSNIFFGYGYEDDEFLQRIKIRNLTIYREHELLTHYRNLGHSGDWTGFDWKHENKNLLYTTDERINFDGLSTVTYENMKINQLPTYTHIVVEISEKAILKKLRKENKSFYNLVARALNP